MAARADLYLRDGIAQVEDVNTRLTHRGQGYASLLVAAAAERAIAAGARTVFLIADKDDWPQQPYQKLGFADLWMTAEFSARLVTG